VLTADLARSRETDKIVRGMAKLLQDECEFEGATPADPREIRRRLFEKATDRYPIVRQPTLGEDTRARCEYGSGRRLRGCA